MKNRSTKVETESVVTYCTESSIHVYFDTLDGQRIELAHFLFPEIYNFSDAQATKIGRSAATAVSDTLKRCVGLKSRPYYNAPKAVTGYVGGVAFPSSFHGKMTLECTQLTCPENTGILCIHNEDSWLSAENVDTVLQIFTWHSHRFYKSLEKVRKQIPPF